MNTAWRFILIAGSCLAFLAAGIAAWVWETIPPEPDPEAIPSSLLEPPPPEYAEAVGEGQSIARRLLAEEKLPGLSLAVAIDGRIVWAEGFRWADMEKERPVTPETLFRIGGISESISAAAAGLLIQRGQLELDEDIQLYLPEFPEKDAPINLRQLMSHTSGILPYRAEGGLFRGACANVDESLARFADESLRYSPGSEMHYSAFGWTLVGAAIAAVSGESYLDFVRREVFAPLNMNRTQADIAGTVEDGSAHFYYPRLALDPSLGLHDAGEVDFSCVLPAVGFLSTPSDLVRFGSAMMSTELLDSDTVDELQTPVALASGEATDRALGWTVQTVPMGEDGTPTRIVGQSLGETVRNVTLGVETLGGQVAGSTATLLTVPEHGIAVAVATNVTGSENVATITLRVADAFYRASTGR